MSIKVTAPRAAVAKGGPLRDMADDAHLFGIVLENNGDGTVSMSGIKDTEEFSIAAMLELLAVPGSTVEGYMVFAKVTAKLTANVPAEVEQVQGRARQYGELPGKTVIGADTYVALAYPMNDAPNGSGSGPFSGADIKKVADDVGVANLMTQAALTQKLVADNAPKDAPA